MQGRNPNLAFLLLLSPRKYSSDFLAEGSALLSIYNHVAAKTNEKCATVTRQTLCMAISKSAHNLL
jgi:hypothetical protein